VFTTLLYLLLARHLPAFLHMAGVGQPAHGLNALTGITFFFVAIISSLSSLQF
jgi:hypothetical protein